MSSGPRQHHVSRGQRDNRKHLIVGVSRVRIVALTSLPCRTTVGTRALGNLRLARSDLLAEYLANTRLLRELGKFEFAARMRAAGRNQPLGDAREKAGFSEPYVLHHSWLPGLVEVSASEAARLRRQIQMSAEAVLEGDLAQILTRLGWDDDSAFDAALVANKAVSVFSAMQNARELARFLEIVRSRAPQVVVEIGTARGGTVYALSQAAASDATIISIDLPGADNCGGQTESERSLFATFGPPGQSFHFLALDSHAEGTLLRLHTLLGGRPIDLLFIDGDHSYDGVRADFLNYAPMVGATGLLGLHDILLMPDEWGAGNEVGPVWRELCARCPTTEIVDPAGVCAQRRPGGVPVAWGIGLINGLACRVALERGL